MEQTESMVSARVRELLADRGVSASEIARRTGLTQSYVSRRVRGAVKWRLDDLQLIADELGVPWTSLLRPPTKAA